MTNEALYNDCNISACMITDGADLDKLFKAVRSCFSSCSEIVICANGKYEEVKFTFRNYSKVKVFPQTWDKDFSKARNEAIEKCKGDWIFIIDSDEELQTPIKFLNDDYDIYLVQMISELDNDMKAFHYEPRIFKASKNIRYSGKIHEQVNLENHEFTRCNVQIEQFRIPASELVTKIKRNAEILESDIDNPNRDYFLCQLHFELGNSHKAIECGEKVIHSDNYNNQTKALVSYWMACASQRFYNSNDVCKQMLMVSLAFEPLQLIARKKMIEILEEEEASNEMLIEQYKTLQNINDNKLSRLPMEVYFSENFLQNKIENLQWQQQ